MPATITTLTSDFAASLPQKKGDPPNFGTVKSGRALAFDGVVDRLERSNLAFTNEASYLTLSCWIKPKADETTAIIGHDDVGSVNTQFFLNQDADNKLYFGCGNGSATASANSDDFVYTSHLNGWIYVVGTFNADLSSNEIKLYINGVLEGEASLAGILASTSASTFYIGHDGGASSLYWSGEMSNLQIWDKTWSLTDVTNAYTHPEMLAHTFSGTSLASTNLKLWYPMTEGNPESPQTTIFDGSGNKNHTTSVFYGDESITDASNRTGFSPLDWAVYGTAGGSVTEVSGKLQVVTETDEANEGTQLANSEFTTPVIGKTYRISAELQQTAGATTPSMIIYYAGTASSTFTITASAVVYTKDIIAANTTGNLYIYNAPSTSSTTFKIDDITIKEVGLSTTGHVEGQETIFQPAFVGQSRPALFNGQSGLGGSSVKATSGTITPLNPLTFSCWFSGKHQGKGALVRQLNWNANGYMIYIATSDRTEVSVDTAHTTGGAGITTFTTATGSRDLLNGDFNHIVVVIEAKPSRRVYINGALMEESTDAFNYDTDATSTINIGQPRSTNAEFDGIINEVSIWADSFTLAEVQELYNDGIPLDATTHSAEVNLKGYWRNDGTSTWSDRQDNITANNLTVANGVSTSLFPEGITSSRDINGFFLTHPNKNYLSCDGVGTYVDVPYSPVFDMGTGDFSIEGWIKTEVTSGYQEVIWLGNTTEAIRFFIASNGKATFKIDEGTHSQDLTPNATTWDDNIWYHFICVCDRVNSKVKVYQNAILIAQSDIDSDITATEDINAPTGILIGKHWSNFDTNFKGFIDDVRVYNRVLTDGGLSESDGLGITASAGGEIRKNYRHGSGKHKD